MTTISGHRQRTANQLHVESLNGTVERMLAQRFPVRKYPVDIHVFQGLQTYLTIKITDGARIDETVKVIPEHYSERGGTVEAVLAGTQDALLRLVNTKQLVVER
jgi:hypothetical protein